MNWGHALFALGGCCGIFAVGAAVALDIHGVSKWWLLGSAGLATICITVAAGLST